MPPPPPAPSLPSEVPTASTSASDGAAFEPMVVRPSPSSAVICPPHPSRRFTRSDAHRSKLQPQGRRLADLQSSAPTLCPSLLTPTRTTRHRRFVVEWPELVGSATGGVRGSIWGGVGGGGAGCRQRNQACRGHPRRIQGATSSVPQRIRGGYDGSGDLHLLAPPAAVGEAKTGATSSFCSHRATTAASTARSGGHARRRGVDGWRSSRTRTPSSPAAGWSSLYRVELWPRGRSTRWGTQVVGDELFLLPCLCEHPHHFAGGVSADAIALPLHRRPLLEQRW